MYRGRPSHRELCTPALGRPIRRNVAERIRKNVIGLDENSIKIYFKYDLKLNLEADLKIELMTETNWAPGNFGLMLFRGYALSYRRFSWLRTFVQTIFVAMFFRVNQISLICNFVQMYMKCRIDGFRYYATLPWCHHNRRE